MESSSAEGLCNHDAEQAVTCADLQDAEIAILGKTERAEQIFGCSLGRQPQQRSHRARVEQPQHAVVLRQAVCSATVLDCLSEVRPSELQPDQ